MGNLIILWGLKVKFYMHKNWLDIREIKNLSVNKILKKSHREHPTEWPFLEVFIYFFNLLVERKWKKTTKKTTFAGCVNLLCYCCCLWNGKARSLLCRGGTNKHKMKCRESAMRIAMLAERNFYVYSKIVN